MIVAGSTNEKHGNNNWIIILLQIISAQQKMEEPRIIGGTNTSHNIEYPFIREVVNNDKQTQKNFNNGKEQIPETPFSLDTYAYIFLKKRKLEDFLKLRNKKIPNLSNVRWNS